MDTATRSALIASAAQQHHRTYGTRVPEPVLAFCREKAPAFEGKVVHLGQPIFEEDTGFGVSTVPPSWSALCQVRLDDAVVGGRGDWKHARHFAPLFALEDGYLVASLEAPHAVGFFAEARWQYDSDGFQTGVLMLWDSLDALTSALKGAQAATDDEQRADGSGAWKAQAVLAGASETDDDA
jgi:hypothetical protein